MRPDGAVAARVAVPGGEARLRVSGATERVLEVDLGDRRGRYTWDPRETGPVLFAQLAAWDEPAGRPLEEPDRAAVLDALWALAPRSGGVRAILEWVGAADACVAWRWDRGPEGHLVRVRARAVEVLELGRTLRAAHHATAPGTDGIPTAVVHRDEARWVFPHDAPVDDAAWERTAARLQVTAPDDLVLTDHPWRFATAG